MKFWDACALTPLFVTESQTPVQALEAGDPFMQVWWGSRVEVASAIFKKVRGGILSNSNGTVAASNAQFHIDSLCAIVAPSQAVLLRATSLVQQYNLGAADSLQLAAFLDSGLCTEFVSFDNRLRHAALAEGATVLP